MNMAISSVGIDLLVAAEICRALARFVPGTAATISELRYHLERDADEYALRCRHEPTALAAIRN